MLLRPDHTILNLQKQGSDEINDILKDFLVLSHRQYTITQLLGNDESAPDGIRSSPLTILDSLELGVTSLEPKLADTWMPQVRRHFLVTKLTIYVFVFSMDEDERTHSLDASSYVSKAYLVALEIIRSSLIEKDSVRAWTSFDFVQILFAAVVLLFISRQYPSTSNQTESRDAIQQAWSLLKACARTEGDHFNRACDVIDWISNTDWTADLAVPEDTSKLLVRSRMEANIVFDIITRAKTRYLTGRNKRRREQLPENKLAVRSKSNPGSVSSELNDMSHITGLTPDMDPSHFAMLDQLGFPWDPNAYSLFPENTDFS